MNRILKSALLAAALLSVISTPAVAQTPPLTSPGTVEDGKPCTAATDCKTSGATCEGTPTVCTVPPAAKLADGAACKADAECESGYCDGAPAVCSAQGDVGAQCKRPEACSSGVCLKDRCVDCASASDCGKGEACVNNTCVAPPGSVADGGACAVDTDCVSGNCEDADKDGTKDTCAAKAVAPVAPPTAPVVPVAPISCPKGTALVTLPDGTPACVPVLQAPQPTAPTPAPVTQPAPISLETVCESFPMSDPSSSDSFDRIAGCVWFATAQACGGSKSQFWGDCALEAQRLAKGKTGVARVQSFFTAGLKLVVEKYGNRLSGRFMDAKDLGALTADLPRFAAALKGTASQGDLLRLALGTVTGGSRAAPRRATVNTVAAPPPSCPDGWTLLATTKSPTYGSSTGPWLCHRSGEEGPGSWREPDYPALK